MDEKDVDLCLLQSFQGRGPRCVSQWECWSCPDAETYLTGIDYYEHPKLCREKLTELYPLLRVLVPEDDSPVERPVQQEGKAVRWGAALTWEWDWGREFRTVEEALAFSPLENADMRQRHVKEQLDYRSEGELCRHFRQQLPDDLGDEAPEDRVVFLAFYNTMFMWPLLTFGWERFLEICLLPEFERIMDEFAELSRRVFRAFSRLPANVIISHDDIVTARGPVCSPQWMHKYVFPRYEEFWGMLRDSGKTVVHLVDGCIDAYVDDVMACGASGVITEPYSDFKAIAKRHPDCVLCGEGDSRVLMSGDAEAIRTMVRSMVETANMCGGYMMGIGNHIPWNVPPESAKVYLDAVHELAFRD
ncbi:MAG: uroporphyrinogen decarboxylase family protein [Candidatus Latescibacteria bacterium]|jgi:hypothetical protein|nr:hypothetical protein [Gemmatimonadaceae bacterium]MDP7449094.1 uroporphyrinogen decarboxylase family protein [Candidatus Latescibacterota bacterium]HJP32507.1 uroporphyrinogen decarboxylase family protein [Candidatus Latescibacterota bacterium]